MHQYINAIRGGTEDRMRLRDELRNSIFLLEMLKNRAEDVEVKDNWAISIQSLGSPHGPLV